MASKVYYSPFIPAFSSNGAPVPGAKLYFFYTGTTTAAPIYLDSGMTTPSANPVQANLAGRFPDLYLDDSITYRVRLTTSTGTPIGDDIDPYVPGQALKGEPGPAGNIAADLSQLETAATTNTSMIYNGAVFNWTLGNFTGEVDDINVVASSGTPVTTGAWVRYKGRVRVAVEDYVLAGMTNNDALQAATDFASLINGVVDLGSGEYEVTPDLDGPGYIGSYGFGESIKIAIEMKSNVHYMGQGATIKVANGISSRAAPQNFAVFYSNAALENVRFEGITFDLNASNNYFSPDPSNTLLPQEDTEGEPGRYLRYHQAAIFWEGTAGKADDVVIDGCTFTNGGGVSTIICGRVGAAGTGRRWRILNSSFINLGLDTYDHSSVFLWCDDAIVSNCIWRNDLIYAPTAANRSGVNAPIETHGSNTIISNNVFENVNRGSFITENGYSRVEGVLFVDNIVKNAKYSGVDVAFDGSGGMGGPRDIVVRGNIFIMSADDTNLDGDSDPGTVVPGAVTVLGLSNTVQNYSPIEGLEISGNRARRGVSGTGRSSNFLAISLQINQYTPVANDGWQRVRIFDNEAMGFTRGIYVISDTTTVCTDFESDNNRFLDPAGGTLPAVTKLGVLFAAQGGTIRRMYFNDKVVDTRSSNSWSFGIVVTETVSTTVRLFEVARTAKFDDRMTFANQISGVFDLSLTKVYGVPVSVTYTTAGALIPANGAGFTGTLVGVGGTGDKLEFADIVQPNNAAWFGRKVFVSAADTVTYHVTNTLSTNADPGTHSVAVYNYPR